jgi:hypothetical protein
MPQGPEEGKCSYRGRSLRIEKYTGKSAEVIVVVEYELRTDTAEVSQSNEGLNDRLPEIR